jgi:hypothetical protein
MDLSAINNRPDAGYVEALEQVVMALREQSAAQQALIAQLQSRIEELEQRLRSNSKTSSKPPSSSSQVIRRVIRVFSGTQRWMPYSIAPGRGGRVRCPRRRRIWLRSCRLKFVTACSRPKQRPQTPATSFHCPNLTPIGTFLCAPLRTHHDTPERMPTARNRTQTTLHGCRRRGTREPGLLKTAVLARARTGGSNPSPSATLTL